MTTERCQATTWSASRRVRGWGNEVSCTGKVHAEGLCLTHLKLKRRDTACCEKCGNDVRDKIQLGGRTLVTSKRAWAWCDCGHLTKFGRDNRIEINRRERKLAKEDS